MKLRQGNTVAALNLAELALEIRLTKLGPHHPDLAAARSVIGECLTELGEYNKAESLLHGALERLRTAQGDSGFEVVMTRRRIEGLLDRRPHLTVAD